MIQRRPLLLLLLTLALAACGGGGGGDDTQDALVRTVLPGMGIDAWQLGFWDPQMPVDHTSWGCLRIDPAQLEKETGIQRGWLNAATDRGWVVVNLPVPSSDEGPFSVHFDLGLDQAEALQQMPLYVMHSNRGLGSIAEYMQDAADFPISHIRLDERGFGPDAELSPDLPPPMLSLQARIPFPFEITTWIQTTTNEQCAQDQCGPMAFANGFQYLEDVGVWTVPHVHDMGLGGDTTLVGQLDTLSGRFFTSRSSGSGVGSDEIVDAALEYAATHGLGTGMVFRHQDQGWGSDLPASDYNAHGLTSRYDGGVPTFAWLRARIGDGCALIAGYSHGGGGHMVRVTGAKVDDAGSEWMRYTHDALQTGSDPTDTLGLETVWVELDDLDGDGMLNLGAVGRELRILWAACP